MSKGNPPSRKFVRAGQIASDIVPNKHGGASIGRQPEQPSPADETLALESARYIGQMAGELAAIARTADLKLLAYFLEMARTEAANSISQLDAAPDLNATPD